MSVKFQKSIQSVIRLLFIDTILYVIHLIDLLSELFISKTEKENRLKRKQVFAKQTVPTDPSSPWKTCEFSDRLTIDDPDTNIFKEFEKSVETFKSLPTCGTRELFSIDDEIQPNGKIFKKYHLGNYKWQTYGRVYERVINISNGFLNCGIDSAHNIVIFAETRAEWTLCALACFRINAPVVTLYATLGKDALTHGINETKCTHVITSSDQLVKFEKILNDIPNLTHIIVMPSLTLATDVENFNKRQSKIDVVPLEDVENKGSEIEENFKKFQSPKRDDLAIIMYTSGSTGNPKGVMMSHGNLLAAMKSFPLRLGKIRHDKDIWLAYLPLAHVLELAAELGCYVGGIRVGYSSPLTLVDNSTAIKRGQKGDLRVLKPTIMAAVPLILERFSKAVNDKISKTNWFTRTLFRKGYDYKLQAVRAGRKTFLLDRVLFRKISKAVLGGRIRNIICGASLLSEEVQEFTQVCLAPVRQAYALTETCAGGTGQYDYEITTQEIGSVVASVELRLVNWLDGGYRCTDKPNPRGEIYIGGDNVTMGYFNMPEKTKEDYHVINGVRYFATGDIGEMLPNGNLKIIDRKKDLVKLQGGEYVSLNKIEAILKLLPYVDNCCVYANPLKHSCICLICPNVLKVQEFAKANNMSIYTDIKSILNNTELMKLVYSDLEQHCRKQGLERFEIPSRIEFVEEVWMPDTGLVTDSFKLKRKALEQFYAKKLENLYR